MLFSLFPTHLPQDNQKKLRQMLQHNQVDIQDEMDGMILVDSNEEMIQKILSDFQLWTYSKVQELGL